MSMSKTIKEQTLRTPKSGFVTFWKNEEINKTIEYSFGDKSQTPYTLVLFTKNLDTGDNYLYIGEIVQQIVDESLCASEAITKALIKGVQIGMMDSVLSDKIMTMDLEIQRIIELNKHIEKEN